MLKRTNETLAMDERPSVRTIFDSLKFLKENICIMDVKLWFGSLTITGQYVTSL